MRRTGKKTKKSRRRKTTRRRLSRRQILKARRFLGRGVWEQIEGQYSEEEAADIAANVRRHVADLKLVARRARRRLKKERESLGRRKEQKAFGTRSRLYGGQLEMRPMPKFNIGVISKLKGPAFLKAVKKIRYQLERGGKVMAKGLTEKEVQTRLQKEKYWKLVRGLSRVTGLKSPAVRDLLRRAVSTAEKRVRRLKKSRTLTKKEKRRLLLSRVKGRVFSQYWALVYELESPSRGRKK